MRLILPTRLTLAGYTPSRYQFEDADLDKPMSHPSSAQQQQM